MHRRVEYFGQKLDGFAFTTGGWVQSYGSRYGALRCFALLLLFLQSSSLC